ncbi:MAG: DUF389 domain-containing protein [Ilumatobacter fluminis]|uniref:DUF389 domain-containing protein n=1 Tax=Ilumatobacter fluminis TaxID=467091 RepID=UPI0032EDB997
MATEPTTDQPADEPAAATGSMTALGTIAQWVDSVLPAEPTADARDAIDELIPTGDGQREYVFRFSALICLSAWIASFGLLADSGAVVIGAMLVAPLMTPIMGAAAAVVTADNRRLLRAMIIIALGTTLAIAVGWATSLIAGGSVIDVRALPGEIRGRTFPGLLDLGVAISAGAAAGYIQPRRSAIAALPGVGIAVALVPPLATVGITAELGLGEESRNAFLLYLTNLAAIIFAAGLVLLLSGFRPHQRHGRGALRKRLFVTTLAVLVVAIPLFRHTQSVIRDLRLESAVVQSVEVWDPDARIVEIRADIAGDEADIELVIVSQGEAEPAWALAELIRDRFDGPVALSVLYQGDEHFVVNAR